MSSFQSPVLSVIQINQLTNSPSALKQTDGLFWLISMPPISLLSDLELVVLLSEEKGLLPRVE